MSEHTSNTTSGPDGEEWERAVGAAKTLLSSDCGWLELFTRAILEEKGVPYGKGLPNPEAPHIPEDKEIEEETMPGQGEPTPTAPVWRDYSTSLTCARCAAPCRATCRVGRNNAWRWPVP